MSIFYKSPENVSRETFSGDLYISDIIQYNETRTKGHKFHACMKIYDFVERKTPKSSHFSKKNERI